ncbi:Y-family DNA polymerase [Marinobacter sp.]|uniref:Y-family DNA polymerase n=1 Tax=Marinobacter sp. TaxID=50741 RepID=UPI00384D5A0C
MLWIYIHFPHLLLDHVRSNRSETGPLVIGDVQQQFVYQACPEARQLGIQPSMRLKTAISLAPDLTIIRTAPEREQQVLEQQARWLYRYAAHVSLHPPHGLVVEASSVNRLHGGMENLWQKLSQAMEQRRLTGRMAAGLTPKAAQQMARAGTGHCSDDRKFLNLSLRKLSIHQAGLPGKTMERLTRLGLVTLDDLFSLPQEEVARRLEPETLRLLQQIEGTRPDPQTAWTPPHRFFQHLDFAQDIEQSAGLLFPLQRLLGELQDDLQWRQQDTDALLLSLHHRNQPETRLELRTAGPEHRATSFLSLIRLRLEQQALAAPVEGLTLSVSRFIDRDRPGGGDLLGSGPPPEEARQDLISRLQARLGDQALRVLASHADHRPEKAWTQGRLRKPVPGATSGDYSLRPLWLLNAPQPVIHLPEAWLAGPERISGGWWDGERVQRDYYIARLTSGQLAWIFRDVSGGWFIHGLFG